ncbi:MAG: DUF481 domain-containing protein [Ketobacteraceae bacterium]|nr:DUF481 domain-containing protein [Ketobacteraceae bacterium]
MAAEVQDAWTGEVSLTYLVNNGNTQGETFGGRAKAVRDWRDWRVTTRLEGVNQSDENGRTGEKYFGAAKLDRKFGEVSYIYGLLEHEDDRFSGYHYQTAISLGYGRTVLDEEAHKLQLEGGPGYRRSEVEEGDKLEEEGFLRGALSYKWTISPSSHLSEELSVEVGEESTISKSSTQLKTKINSTLSLTVGYDVKHNSDVPPDTKNTDTTTYVTLDYSF